MEKVTFPAPPEGFEYKLVAKPNKPQVKDKDPADLTPKQIADLKYREKNKEKVREKNRRLYEKNKEKIKEEKRLIYQEKKSVVTSGQSQ
jgi:hypothetical protein